MKLTPVTLLLTPTIKTVVAKTAWTCAQATAANKVSVVSWTSQNAAKVAVYGPGYKQPMKFGANASADFWLVCGTTSKLTLTPYASNGTAGTPRTLTITVSA